MLYHGYEAWSDLIAPWRQGAQVALGLRGAMADAADRFDPLGLSQRAFALLDMMAHSRIRHVRPPFRIDAVQSGRRRLPVREEVALELPFCDLVRFVREGAPAGQPKLLIVAPLSGHFATLLRGTIRTALADHEVWVTDWKNARDVPLAAGRFGFAEYVDYLIRFLAHLGPDAHLLAVCQPCAPALAAAALMAEDGHQSVPASLILMGGPVDVRVAPTKVNEVAFDRPLSWFEQHVIHPVPDRHVGRGRRVYPGFLQLGGFMSMNPARHSDQHRALLGHLAEGRADEASRIREFYDEYFAVLDIDADFYLETIDLVFQRCALAEGKLAHRGRPVRPAAITTTALLTIEGERDDICAPGQTSAAHALCSGLPDALKHAHVQPGVGHYGIFSGSRWESDIYPLVRRHIAAARAKPATAKKRSSPDSPGSRR